MKGIDIQQGDILTFKADDDKYKVLICTSRYVVKSPHHFTFAALTYDDNSKPTLNSIIEGEFFGIGSRIGGQFRYSDEELDKMWSVHPEIIPYCLGSYGFIIWRKSLVSFYNNLEKIGNLNIVDHLDKNGNGSMNSSGWERLKDFFKEKYKTILPYRGQSTFKVKAIIK